MDKGSSSNGDEAFSPAQEARLRLTTSTLFDSLDRYETQECLSFMQNHWMLSIDDFKVPTEPPKGLISELTPLKSNHCWVLMPEEEGCERYDFKVIHQIIRELTIGIYVLNQVPNLSLESNFDCSTTVQLPPAYIDTKVGQLLTNVDYIMKSLWHGSYIPREKRQKFTDRWRKKLDVNMETGQAESKSPHIMDFHGAGMIDVTKIKEYQGIYSSLPTESPGDAEAMESKRFFMDHAEDMTIRMNVFMKSVEQHKNMFLVDGDWTVSSVVKLTDDKMDSVGYERLQSRLRVQKDVIKDSLTKRDDTRHQLSLIKFVAFMVPFLCAMRRKMKIPDISKLLPPILGESVKTERELPPLMTGEGYACKNFAYKDQIFSLHGGILIDLETPDPVSMNTDLSSHYDHLVNAVRAKNEKVLDPSTPPQEAYDMPLVEVNGKRYYMVKIEFDTYYPQAPRKPRWLQSLNEKIAALKPKKLPIQEPQMMDIYKKIFGYRRALKFKAGRDEKEQNMSDDMNLPAGLKVAAQRGLVSIFSELTRKSQMSQLTKQDEAGLSLIHHAALNNRPQIIAKLILQSMDVNARRNQSVLSIGSRNYLLDGDEGSTRPTALHLAARCGAIDAVACLCANYANYLVIDHNGWAPIHQAAYYNHVPIIRMLVRKRDSLLELATQNEEENTPMLLAASSGALEAVCCLIDLGAKVLMTNRKGHNLLHLAALRSHTNILEYFIHHQQPGVSVWTVLVEMLGDGDYTMQDSAVKCMETLSLGNRDHWQAIRDYKGIPALVKLLQSDRPDIQSVSASVLCNISEEDDIRSELAACGASPILITLLSSPLDDIQSRAAIIMADIACVENNQTELARLGAIPPLIALLESELEDVLVNAVNALRVLSISNEQNQTEMAEKGAIYPLVEFLSSNDSDILQAAAASALAAMCTNHRENQDKVREADAIDPLVRLIESRHTTVQMKASSTIQAMCTDNPINQQEFLDREAPRSLIRLLKFWSIAVKEQGACALWAIAGHTKPQQRDIAEKVGVTQIIDMLLLKSEKLQYVGCMAMMALCRENVEYQNKMCEEGGIEPLVRLIKSTKSSEQVLLTSIQTLGILCIGVAHRNNKRAQSKISDGNAIPVLVGLMLTPPSQEIQVEVACSLACIVLGNTTNQEKLKSIPSFKYTTLINLLKVKNANIRLQAGNALAIFGFNNSSQQYAIREAGGISYSLFVPFLTSGNEFHRASASFQIVVLARVIVDRDQVSLTAEGVTSLVELLQSTVDNVVILSASLLSSLAHTRAGIPDAMVTSGAMEVLMQHLNSQYHLVRTSCAVALGYLSFNKTAARKLFSCCRNTPGLYDKLIDNIDSDARISDEFRQDFERAKKIGLPSQSLEKNGGPPACPPKRQGSSRPKTGLSYSKGYRDSRASTAKAKLASRAVSAPAKARTRSAI